MNKRYRIVAKQGYNGCIPITIYWVQMRKKGLFSDKWEYIKGFDRYERAVGLLFFLSDNVKLINNNKGMNNMEQTLEEAAIEGAKGYNIVGQTIYKSGFKSGAEWQSKQSPWISVEERLPDDNENIIIMCEHGAIFNGTYYNNVWFCMDGYIQDTFRGTPVYSSMVSIPPLWKPVMWMPIPKLNE